MEAKRIPPCPDYDIRGTEQWLEDMALKGYTLCKGHAFQYGFAYFKTGQPRRIRYRITPAKKVPQTIASPNNSPDPPDEETLDFHSQFGWEYTTYRGQFWIFRCEDPTAPEMNTDPRVQAIALEVAEKRLREHFFSLLIYGVILIASRSPLFCSTLVEYGITHYWPVPIFLILVCIAWLPGVLHIVRFRRDNSLLPLTLEEADWVRAYHVHSPRWHRLPHDELLIQKDNVFIQCTLQLYGEAPESYTMEELAQFLLEWEG